MLKGVYSSYSNQTLDKTSFHLDVMPVPNNDMDRFNAGTDFVKNYEMVEGIFWYLSYNDNTIRQYEDGYPIAKLDYIKIIPSKLNNDSESDVSDFDDHENSENITHNFSEDEE